jgi:hypothetical protein
VGIPGGCSSPAKGLTKTRRRAVRSLRHLARSAAALGQSSPPEREAPRKSAHGRTRTGDAEKGKPGRSPQRRTGAIGFRFNRRTGTPCRPHPPGLISTVRGKKGLFKNYIVLVFFF